MFSRTRLALSLVALSLCSCARPKPPETPAASEGEAVAHSPQSAAESETEGTIKISQTIQRACGLGETEAHFKFDSSALQNADSSTLNKVAACFIGGRLAGERMSLVGRTDPRGDSEYNVVLGGTRSDNVKIHLVNQGMNADYIAATSRGEIDATGVDEAGWRQDRRVDVMLVSEQ